MPNQPCSGTRCGASSRATKILAGIRALVTTSAATVAGTTIPAAVVTTALLATGATVAGAGGPRAGAFAHPSGTQQAIVDEALRNGAVPPELALAVARVVPDGRYAAGYAGDGRLSGHAGYRARSVRQGVARLERLYRRYGERWDLALSHYYGGPLTRCEGRYVSHVHTVSQVTDVMEWWRRYQEDPTLEDLVRRTRAMRVRGARFAALGSGDGSGGDGNVGRDGGGPAPGTDYDTHRRRADERLRTDRGGYAALPFVQGRFRSDDRPAYGVARADRFN